MKINQKTKAEDMKFFISTEGKNKKGFNLN
jgi:hypothetical protein